MLSTFFLLLPHTLKVNELPSHTHNIPGYYYQDEKSGYYLLNAANGEFEMVAQVKNASGGTFYHIISNSNDFNGISAVKNYRAFMLGTSTSGSPTTEKGNNESQKKSNLIKSLFQILKECNNSKY